MQNKVKAVLCGCLLLFTAFVYPASEDEKITWIPDLSIGADAGDAQGRLYFVEEEDFPRVVRYRWEQ